MGAVSGVLISFIVAFFMPLPDNPSARTSQSWKFAFGLPIVFALSQLISFIFIFKHDTPIFYQQNEEEKKAVIISDLLYFPDELSTLETTHSQKHKYEDENEINSGSRQHADRMPLEELKGQPNTPYEEGDYEDFSDITPNKNNYSNSNNNDKIDKSKPISSWPSYYKRALLISCILSIMHQCTGINAIVFFSNEIFSEGEKGNEAVIQARIGTFMVGIASFLGTATSFPLLR
mmetsp:Transcript_23401/g.20794  ORF Transcript_23401/g.20794 Transcript_23401/m.20794 type:complete len:233 (+) Transcript_23401:437-1135(+)|eukprot:CAMPEP_0205817574 /NCGR_PEP_ID=MMETSP0205-20121125/24552_1 /ASSEMBLY_ACC=CAM_ASM_000278 /TAXON_ID=36767 /ORGANISM="Euplotes focardii, Strain TN1" /LENGTH=232 /DNA_ID=CAMNT_0053108437 /DNA_START=348 /DNA_END=1046 /DNA_ORIENTATION=+